MWSMSTPYDVSMRRQTTEDGDVTFIRTAMVSSVAAARDCGDIIRSMRVLWNGLWKCQGGQYSTEYSYTVDGAVVAIEASNDYWASMQDDR